MRTRTSFQKRQKEIARMEKQRDKAARRQQRKLEGPKPDESDLTADLAADPDADPDAAVSPLEPPPPVLENK
jgi:hypothetical protein